MVILNFAKKDIAFFVGYPAIMALKAMKRQTLLLSLHWICLYQVGLPSLAANQCAAGGRRGRRVQQQLSHRLWTPPPQLSLAHSSSLLCCNHIPYHVDSTTSNWCGVHGIRLTSCLGHISRGRLMRTPQDKQSRRLLTSERTTIFQF